MGQNLKQLRKNHKISQEQLCAELQRRGCDIGRTTYAKYEAGQLNIRASVLISLKKIYGCAYDDFFSGLDDKPIKPLNHRAIPPQAVSHGSLILRFTCVVDASAGLPPFRYAAHPAQVSLRINRTTAP